MIPRARAETCAAAVLVVVAVLGGAPGEAGARPQATSADGGGPGPDPEALASQRFQEGTRAFDAGDFVAAARLFLEAYATRPHHAALWNAARAQRRAGDLASAANLYRRYLREAPVGTPDRDAAIADLAQLEPLLGRLEIVAPGAVEVAVDGVAASDTVVWVNPGAHVVRATIAGAEVVATPTVAAGGIVAVALVAPAPAPPSGGSGRAGNAAPGMGTAGSGPATAGDSRLEEDEGGWPAWALLPLAGATVLAAGGLVASGVDTLNLREEFDASGGTDGYAYDNGVFAMDRTNVLVGITVGLGAVTAGFALFAIDWNGGAPGGRVVGVPHPGGLTARAEL